MAGAFSLGLFVGLALCGVLSWLRPADRSRMPLSFLSAEQAKLVDEELMGPMGFTVDQLMELAGLSVACAVQKEFPPSPALVICGPGNNGGDGLVAARHLTHFGFAVTLLYPVQKDVKLYQNLLLQCQDLDIPVLTTLPALDKFAVIVDGIFGFSFSGAVREPFLTILTALQKTTIPIASIDIPSGWDVDGGAPTVALNPKVLISLTTPKKCAQGFSGVHYVGGRFVSPRFATKHGILLPTYPGAEQCVRVDG